jgi:hypothetical protein
MTPPLSHLHKQVASAVSPGAKIELDLFSGQPNPSWSLDERQTRHLRLLHEQRSEPAAQVPEPPGLGYRGFTYDLDGVRWRAFNGHVTGSNGRTARNDAVEPYLLSRLPDEYQPLGVRIRATRR